MLCTDIFTREHYADGQEQRAENGQRDHTVGPDGYDAPDGDAAVDFLHGRRHVRPVSGGRRTYSQRDRRHECTIILYGVHCQRRRRRCRATDFGVLAVSNGLRTVTGNNMTRIRN